MTKAYTMNARKIWVLNVGDIKPAEYTTQLFMDMAYDITPFQNSSYSTTHLQQWLSGIFGPGQAAAMKNLFWQYYDLAFERKPEFMGWSQTEPTRPVQFTAYNHTYYGDQAQQRIDSYTALANTVNTLRGQIPAAQKDAFYELVDYPVTCAAWMNKKFLYRDKAYLYAMQGRSSARQYAALSEQAYEEIVQATGYYNSRLANGKWAGMLSMNPRKLPVFEPPVLPLPVVKSAVMWRVTPEAAVDTGSTADKHAPLALPAFNRWSRQQHFMDLYLCQDSTVPYRIETTADWIRVSSRQGTLTPQGNNSQCRIWVTIDWSRMPQQRLEGAVLVKSGLLQYTIAVKADNAPVAALEGYAGFVAADGYLSVYASHYSNKRDGNVLQWAMVEGLGSGGAALEALPLQVATLSGTIDTTSIRSNPSVEYDFYTFEAAAARCSIYTLPTCPLNKSVDMRYAVSIDEGPLTVLQFKTVGRSEEWKQNVLGNAAIRTIQVPSLPAGKHRFTIYMIDPGVVLDRLFIDLGTHPSFYGGLPETR
jgi:hypothetical protein